MMTNFNNSSNGKKGVMSMNSLIIYAHPNPNSFNSAVRDTIVDELLNMGHNVCVRDLYALNFDPILHTDDFENIGNRVVPDSIQLEKDYLGEADNIIFIYPTWFMNMPAILKGYFDRVFYYSFSENPNDPHKLVKGKPVIIYQTTGAPENSLDQSHLVTAMKHIQDTGVLELAGMQVLLHEFLFEVPFSQHQKRNEMLSYIRGTLHNLNRAYSTM